MKNYRDIKVEVTADFLEMSSSMVKQPNQNMMKMFPRLMSNIFEMGNGMLSSPEFKKIMNEEKFDLVVIGMFFNDYLLGVGDHFKCPTIMLSVAGAFTFTNIMFGNPLGVGAVRHPIHNGDTKTFPQRIVNFLAFGGDLLMKFYIDYQMKISYE